MYEGSVTRPDNDLILSFPVTMNFHAMSVVS